MPIHCFLFEIDIVKNGFTGPISYRVFRETDPWIGLRIVGTQRGTLTGVLLFLHQIITLVTLLTKNASESQEEDSGRLQSTVVVTVFGNKNRPLFFWLSLMRRHILAF